MATVERVSPETWDMNYRMNLSDLIERSYYDGAILVLWFAYLVWRWVRAFRESRHPPLPPDGTSLELP
jgi:hypothetical protein